MKVKCVDDINKTWRDRKLPFTIGEIYEGMIDNEFLSVVQLYIVDDNGDETTIASLGSDD